MKSWIPKVALAAGALIALVYAGAGLHSPDFERPYAIRAVAELPVQVGGRLKPLDSVARNSLLILAKKQTVETPDGRKLSAIEWLMDVTMRPEVADDYKVFKIEFPDDLGLVGLAQPGQRHYSFNELRPYFQQIADQFAELNPETQLRTGYERQISRLYESLTLYHRLVHSLQPAGTPGKLEAEYAAWLVSIGPGMQALRAQQAGEPYDQEALDRFMTFSDRYLDLSKTAYLAIIPPIDEATNQEDWHNIGQGLLDTILAGELPRYVRDYARLIDAYRAQDARTFNEVALDMREHFKNTYPDEVDHVDFEYRFNWAEPFYRSSVLYVLIFLAAVGSWLRWPHILTPFALGLLAVTFLAHTAGLVSRMVIQDRPPVTNLYSSAVFVGWGAVGLGLIMEKFWRNGVGAATAAMVGFSTLIIAHHLGMSGDTLEMMRAVLDSNFWLATHVIVITIGYSAMFLAGALGIVFILKGLLSRGFDQKQAKTLTGMVYGVLCFGVLFSLVGTILGGIWADQSWGRFWGWDPKENGALLIVLIGAIALHARWGGLVRERGLMNLAITGNIVTAWSWFGTNMLGVGLHSYGFIDSAFFWLATFVISQLALIGAGSLPWRYWKSPYGRDQLRRENRRAPDSGKGEARTEAEANKPVGAGR
ncbi:MAG: cytochrome c biogenesis protein [Opitutales bacterium]